MGFGLGVVFFLDEVALGAVDQTQLRDLIQQLGVFGAQHGQALVVAGRDLHSLPELCAGKRLAQYQHAELLQFVGDLVGGGGLGQQNDAGIGLGHGVGAQLVAELIGQRRVDDDDLKVLGVYLAARLAAAGSHHGAGVAQLRHVFGQVFVCIVAR